MVPFITLSLHYVYTKLDKMVSLPMIPMMNIIFYRECIYNQLLKTRDTNLMHRHLQIKSKKINHK